ncbi:hypothetical protein WI35_15535 [Burkholderia ubonensis]|nr:hypothetical protein WI35_15535 [Burkholderia ubonensis]
MKVTRAIEVGITYSERPERKGTVDLDKGWSERVKMMDLLQTTLRHCVDAIDPVEIEKIASIPNHCAANIMRSRVLLIEVGRSLDNAIYAGGPIPQISQLNEINKTLVTINELVSSTADVCKHEIGQLTKRR